ncbi:uncharacterized protein PRD47_001943 isoform 1-T1 [Ara ararauna]
MNWKMEMDVKGVSPCQEPIPPAAGSGGCPHQRPHHRDGQPAEPAPATDSGPPERRHGSEKEDKKASALKQSGFHWAWCLLMTGNLLLKQILEAVADLWLWNLCTYNCYCVCLFDHGRIFNVS